MPGPLAGAAISAGGIGLADLLLKLFARKSGRKVTSNVVSQLFGKQVRNPSLARGALRRTARGSAQIGGAIGGFELLASSLLGEPEEQNALAAAFANRTIPLQSQEDVQLEQLLSHLLANSEQEPFL